MKLRTFAGALALALALTPSAFAQEQAPSAKQLELARRYMAAANVERAIGVAMDTLGPLLIGQYSRGSGGLNPAQRGFVLGAVKDSVQAIMPKILDTLTPVYARNFSEQELTDIVAFFESPSGRAMSDKTPVLSAEVNTAMQRLVPDIQAEVTQRVCADLACTALKGGR